MKKSHIEAIYEAKRTILRNQAEIIALKRRQEHDAAAKLLKENEKLQQEIQHKYGIILDY